ncbi:MAG TPA: hypothetical protein VJL80_06285 [Aeromicrobium sp.]|nr:hypothetical protein [Aeromicrobium sp.]HKY57627.1 hypothetical protein [Aeromicrobium sp.]
MSPGYLLLLAAFLGALFGGALVRCMQAGFTVDNAPVPPKEPTPEQLQVRHDCNAATLAHIAREHAADDDLHHAPGLLDYRIGAGRRELARDPVANVVAGPWRPVVVPGQRGGDSA